MSRIASAPTADQAFIASRGVMVPTRINQTGRENMSARIFPGRGFRWCYARCRFFVVYGGTTPTLPTFSDLVVSFDAGAGDEYDCELYRVSQRGYGRDMNLVLTADENAEPSPWSFGPGDAIVFTWPNPDEIGWGLEIGVA